MKINELIKLSLGQQKCARKFYRKASMIYNYWSLWQKRSPVISSVPRSHSVGKLFKMRISPVSVSATIAACTKTKIVLYYDVMSPFSWFAFEVLHRYKAHWNIDLHLKPVLLAGIIKTIGTTPKMLQPRNVEYHKEDIKRCARYFGVPLKMTDSIYESVIVKGTPLPSCFLTAIDLLHPDLLEKASRELWVSAWSKHEDLSLSEVLTAAGLVAGLTPETLVEVKENMNQPATMQRLKAYTEEAVEHGAFGVPTILVHKREKPTLFFGSDRFHLIARELNETWVGPEPSVVHAKL